MQNSFLFQYSISYLFAGLIFSFLAIFVFVKSPKSAVNRIFAFYSLCIAWWSVFSIFMINSPNEFWGTLWDRICLMGIVLIPCTFIHFNFTFLKINRKYGWFIFVNYLICLFFFIMNFTSCFVAGTSPKFGLKFYTNPGIFYLPFIIYFFTLCTFGIGVFFFALKKSSGSRKQQISYLLWSTLLGYSMGGLNYNLSFGIGPEILALLGNYAISIYGIIVTYTITKYRLMDIKIIINRVMAYFILIIIYSFLGAISVYLYSQFFSFGLNLQTFILLFLLFLLVGISFHPLRLHLQTTPDRFLFRQKYLYEQAIKELSKVSGSTVDLHILINTFKEKIKNVIKTRKIELYLINNEKNFDINS